VFVETKESGKNDQKDNKTNLVKHHFKH